MKRRVVAVFLLFLIAAAIADETVYVTRTGTKYHRAGCRHLAKSAISMALSEAATRYSPCSVCSPPFLNQARSTGPLASAAIPNDLQNLEAERANLQRQLTTITAQIQAIDVRIAQLRAGSAPRVSVPPVAPPARSATPAYSGRCQATTKKGTQCSRQAKPGSRYCWQHGG